MDDLTAYHEAGHAWMAVWVGARVRAVSIAPELDDRDERFGDTQVEWRLSEFSADELAAKSAWVALAGPAAEMAYRSEPYHPGLVAEWAEDWREAWQVVAALRPHERQRMQYLEQQTLQICRLFEDEANWAAVAEIADLLLAHEMLEGEQIEECVNRWGDVESEW